MADIGITSIENASRHGFIEQIGLKVGVKRFMENLSTKQLLEILNQAIELNISQDFINLLINEIYKRFGVQLAVTYNYSKMKVVR